MRMRSRVSLLAPLERRERRLGLAAVALTLLIVACVANTARIIVTTAASAEYFWYRHNYPVLGEDALRNALFLVSHPWLTLLISAVCCLGAYQLARTLLRRWPGAEKAYFAVLLLAAALALLMTWNTLDWQRRAAGPKLGQRIDAMQPQTHLRP